MAFEEIQRQIQGIELLPDEAEQVLHTQLDEKEREVRRWEQAKAEQQKLQEAFRTAEQFLSLPPAATAGGCQPFGTGDKALGGGSPGL